MSNEYSIFTHDSLKKRIERILRSVGNIWDEFISDSTILSIVVDYMNLRLEELIK